MSDQKFSLYTLVLIAAIVSTVLVIVIVSASYPTPPTNAAEWLHYLFVQFFSWALLLFTCALYVCALAIVVRAVRAPDGPPEQPPLSYNRGNLRMYADRRRYKLQQKRHSRKLENDH